MRIVKTEYSSPLAMRGVPLFALLPESDAESVVFVLHGYGEDCGTHFRRISENAALISAAEDKRAALVFPYIYLDKRRVRCTPLDFASPAVYDRFPDELHSSVIPFLIREGIVPRSGCPFSVAGFSVGGREALLSALRYPGEFTLCGAAAPSPGLTDAGARPLFPPVYSREEFSAAALSSGTRFTIVSGERDGIVGDAPAQYARAIRESGAECGFISLPSASHEPLLLDECVAAVLGCKTKSEETR